MEPPSGAAEKGWCGRGRRTTRSDSRRSLLSSRPNGWVFVAAQLPSLRAHRSLPPGPGLCAQEADLKRRKEEEEHRRKAHLKMLLKGAAVCGGHRSLSTETCSAAHSDAFVAAAGASRRARRDRTSSHEDSPSGFSGCGRLSRLRRRRRPPPLPLPRLWQRQRRPGTV